MKTKFKRISKSALSIILALMMVISTMLVGIVSVSAWSSGETHKYYISNDITRQWGNQASSTTCTRESNSKYYYDFYLQNTDNDVYYRYWSVNDNKSCGADSGDGTKITTEGSQAKAGDNCWYFDTADLTESGFYKVSLALDPTGGSNYSGWAYYNSNKLTYMSPVFSLSTANAGDTITLTDYTSITSNSNVGTVNYSYSYSTDNSNFTDISGNTWTPASAGDYYIKVVAKDTGVINGTNARSERTETVTQKVVVSSSASTTDYYIEGRFRIKNADGEDIKFDWASTSTDIHFDGNTGTEGLYKLETNCTLEELSENIISNNPQYFYVWDKTANTYYSADNDNLENYSSSANAVTLNSCTFNNNSNWMCFNSSSTSNAKVTLWLDTRNDQKKLYYTTDATPVESDDYTLYDYSTNSESSLGEFSKNDDGTYSLELPLSAKEYKLFVKDKSGANYFNEAKEFNNGSITLLDYDNLEHTISFTPSPAGAYKFTLTPGRNVTQKTVTLSVKRISELGSLYISSNLNDTTVTWEGIADNSVYSKTVSDGYTFAFSNKEDYSSDFATDFSVAEDKTVFCSVTKGTKVYNEETGDSVTTYTVNANAGCTDPTLYVDPATSTVYAIAKYDKTSATNSERTIDSTKKVTYYFAVRPEDENDDGLENGIKIKYWNNSLAANNWTQGSVDTINATTAVNNGTANNNTIYINGSELFDSGLSNTNEQFKIYSADLPVWATSFAFTDSSYTPISVRSTLQNNTATNNASLVLNPNRVYLYYSLNKGENYAKGVVLDDSLWTENGTNAVSTKTFKANAVNFDTTYKSTNTKGEIANDFNKNKLTPVYPTNYAHPLYFGYIGKDWGAGYVNNSNFKIWDNLAMRTENEDDGRYYYASVQGLAGSKLSSSKNSNGYGLLYGYDNQTLMPLFDYSKLVKNGLAAEGNVHQGLNFPFNQSTFGGVTTYSYDSTTDKNRLYDSSTKDFKVDDYTFGTISTGTNELGYYPFGSGQYGFSTEFDIDFYMTGDGKINGQDIKFNFSGDDDVWVYVDGVLVLDLGGAHKISAGSINFSDMKVYYKSAIKDTGSISNITDGFAVNSDYVKTVDLKNLFAAYGVDFKNNDASTKHTLQMFYMERGCFDSNCSISFNLPQNSGLRVENDIDLSNVNSAFKADTLKTANGDYFSYTVENALASDDKYNSVNTWNKNFGSGIDAIAKSVADDFSNALSLSSPVYNGRLDNDVNRQIDSSTTIKLKSQTTGDGTPSNNYLNGVSVTENNFFQLNGVNFSLFDKYATSEGASTEVIGRTTANGDLGLLYGQTAQFDSKITPNSLVKISQNNTLKSVDTNGTTIALGSANGRNASDYYTTTYTVTDTNTKKNGSDLTIGDGHNLNSTDNIVAFGNNSGLSASDGFYFTNYGDASSNSIAMVVNYTNTVSTGNLKISKALKTEDQSNANFKFTVKFANVFGGSDDEYKEYIDGSLKYTVYDKDDKIVATRYYSNGVYIKATQYAVIEGVPVGTKYSITEQEIGGYELNKIDTPTVSNVKSDLTLNDLGISVSNANKQSTGTIPTVDKLTSATAVSETAFTYINKFATLTVNFKYYDRKVTSGTVSQIDTTPSTMKYSFDVNPITGMYIGEESTENFDPSQYKGEGGTTGFAAVVANAFKSVGSKIGNVVDEYVCFNTQADAINGMPEQKDYHVKTELVGKDKNGTLVYKLADGSYSLDNVAAAPNYAESRNITTVNAASYFTCHTNCYSEPQTSGEKWVTYYDKSDNVIDSNDGLTNADLANVDHIDVWLFNNLKQYTVTAYTASDGTDLINNIATSNPKPITTFYNVRFGVENGHYEKVDTEPANDVICLKDESGKYSVWVTSTDRNTAGEYLDKYGFNGIGYTGSYPVTAPEINGTKFSHWAYNDNGKYVPITTDIDYGYRVTRDLDVYAVYSNDELNSGLPGVSVIQNTPDHFVNGTTSSTRLNTQMNVYNCPDNDTNIQQAAIVYVMAKNFTEDSLTQEQLQKLRTDIADILNQRISDAGKYPLSKVLEIGVDKYSANCFVYDINYNTTSDTTYKSSLTNKNRGQFTTTFTDENLARFERMFAFAAVKYTFEDESKNPWIVSDNYIDYKATSLGVTA